ncbi:MAG: desulfoferrodoxin family protein [Coriobacteriia bacterium]|nr:desulfoferrodoxin family protein [Coriobacteriia bacterium]
MNESPILGGVHTVDNLDTADDFHKKHVPFIATVREGDVVTITVEVGHYVAHPNLPDHWIDLVEIYAANAPIATVNFAAGVVAPKVTAVATLDPDTKIMVSARCNLHGLWVAETSV